MLCVLKVSYTLIKHLNKEVLETGGRKYIGTCEHVQYVCRKLGVGTGKLNSIRMLAAYHNNV